MKNLSKTVATLCFVAVTFYLQAKLPTYSLTDAIKKKLITVEIKGADQTQPNSSGHYGKCIQMEITNLTTQRFKLQLDAGQQFEPGDSSIQNMMVTEGELFVFTPKKHRKEYINAMCVQKHDGGPNATVNFSMGSMSDGHLLGIAQLLDKHKYFNSTAQDAVWCISDGENISSITGDDPKMVQILQKFVSEATGQPIPKRYPTSQKPRPQRRERTERIDKHNIVFEWVTSKEYKTTLVVLNKDNKPVQEIMKDVMLPAGNHREEIVLSTENLPKGYYRIVLYINDRPQMHRKIKLGR